MRETIVDRAYAKTLLPPRKEDGHKGDFGKLLVLGGSVGYTGAPYLAASAAVHSGCGLVYLGVPESIWAVEAQKCVSAMPFPLPETDGRLCLAALDKMQDKLKGCDVLALGPGLGRGKETEQLVHALLWQARQPMVLELGCGKGGFLAQMAPAHPEKNYIALDVKSEMLVLAKRKAEEAYAAAGVPMDNFLMTAVDIERIFLIMDETDQFDEVYINFCPPCPKCRQHKHRLTHPRQLERYQKLMAPGARLYFKTDDDDLFMASLGYLEEAGWVLDYRTHDLHREGAPAESPRTEHEEMFAGQGIRIKYLIAPPPEENQ